jgi:AraC-like DNA-binding protein
MSQVRATKAVLAVVGFAATAGVAPPVLLQAAGIDPALLTGPDAYLLLTQEQRLWHEAARLTGDPDFGLHLAEWAVPRMEEQFDVLAFAVRSCATLGEHYRRVGRYLRLIHDGIYLSLTEESDMARLVTGHHHDPTSPRHPVECQLAISVLQARRATGEDFAPRAVYFAHARPARLTEHERLFRAPVYYDCPRSELLLDRACLDRPQRQAEPRLLAYLDRQIDGLLAELPDSQRVGDAVKRCMKDQLPDREPSMAIIAEKLHMSPRSLQRRLHSEGTSFAELLSELRRDLALRYLRDQRIAIAEVGFLLGFLDVSAFHRAFKRWTGSTPAEYQRSTHPRE